MNQRPEDRGRSASAGALRLGHITYSNCFPVHARLLDYPSTGDPSLVEGVPSVLNGMLERGEIDVSPSSSIEFALNAERYRVLPNLVIGSRGPVRSILFISSGDPSRLGGRTVAIPTASATSVVLLKILLKIRWQVDVHFQWFDQATEDPFAAGAAAALFIGDIALRENLHSRQPARFDLGQIWWEETGLPFAFAVWQTGSSRTDELRELHRLLLESRTFGMEERDELAVRYSRHFRMPAAALATYWSDLSYDLDGAMRDGLMRFYTLASEIGELARVPTIRWIE